MLQLNQITLAMRNRLLVKGAVNIEIGLEDAYHFVTNPSPSEQRLLEEIRGLANEWINAPLSDRPAIKEVLSKRKQNLPIFLLSGFTPFGHGSGHLDEFKYNGIVQLDVDFKRDGGQELAKRFKEAIAGWPHLVFGGFSPSGVGFKGVVVTSNTDPLLHLCVSSLVWNKAVEFIRTVDPTLADEITQRDPHDDIQYGNPCYIWGDSVPFNHSASVIKIGKSELYEIGKNKAVEVQDLDTRFKNTCDDEFKRDILELLKEHRVDNITWHKIIHAMKNSGFTIEDARFVTAAGLKPNEIEGIGKTWTQNYSKYKIGTIIYYLRQFHPKDKVNEVLFRARERVEAQTIAAQQAACKFVLDQGEFLGTHGTKIKDTILSIDGTVELVAPTGTGKTKFMLQSWKGVDRVLCFPTNALIQQTMVDERDRMDIAQFNGDLKDVDCESECIVTNYASLALLAERLKAMGQLGSYTLFIDEAHNLVTTMDYQSEQINQIAEVMRHFKQTVLVTATPVHAYDARIQPTERVTVLQKTPQPKRLVTFQAKSIDMLVEVVNARKTDGESFAVFLNNTKDEGFFGKVKSVLENKEIPFTVVNAKTKDEEAFKTVVADGSMQGVQAVLATCILKEGVSIRENTSDRVHIVMLGAWGPEEIAQCAARFRSAREVIVYRASESSEFNRVPGMSRHSIGHFCATTFKRNLPLTEIVCPTEETAGLMSTILGSKCYNFMTKRMDWLVLGFEAYTASKRYANRYPQVMAQALVNEYGFKSCEWRDAERAATEADILGHEENKAAIKTKRMIALNTAADTMIGKTLNDLQETLDKTEVTKEWAELREKVVQLAKATSTTHNSPVTDIVQWIRSEAEFKTARVNRMIERTMIRKARKDTVSKINNVQLAKVVDEVYSTFGAKAVSGKIKIDRATAKLLLSGCELSVFNLDTDACKWTDTRVVQILGMFYDVKINHHNRTELILTEFTDADFLSFDNSVKKEMKTNRKQPILKALLAELKG